MSGTPFFRITRALRLIRTSTLRGYFQCESRSFISYFLEKYISSISKVNFSRIYVLSYLSEYIFYNNYRLNYCGSKKIFASIHQHLITVLLQTFNSIPCSIRFSMRNFLPYMSKFCIQQSYWLRFSNFQSVIFCDKNRSCGGCHGYSMIPPLVFSRPRHVTASTAIH